MSIYLQIEEFVKEKTQLRFREECYFPNRSGHVSVILVFLVIIYDFLPEKDLQQQAGLRFVRQLSTLI